MCGIAGYAGGGKAARIIYSELEKLEYRGYDSAGIAVICGDKLSCFKRLGRVSVLREFAGRCGGSLGIGHTRWATHGRPSDANAHPHIYKKTAVVHNGIIENYAELRRRLEEEGDLFTSDTDSEVAAHLIEKFFSGDLCEAVRRCARLLKGSYALAVVREGCGGIAVARMRSPMIIGRGCGENFIASDRPALAGKCSSVCALRDGDFAYVCANSVEITDISGAPVEREFTADVFTRESVGKCGYPHFMAKELSESPTAVKRTAEEFPRAEKELFNALKDVRKLVFTGCGTAYHAALAGRRYAEELAGIPSEAEFAGELRCKTPLAGADTALIAVTQSGETADTVEAARLYKGLGARVIAVTNSPRSAITDLADAVAPVCAGPEICVAATKSYLGQLAALHCMALLFADGNKRLAATEELLAVPAFIERTLSEADMYPLAMKCARARGVYFMGRGADYPTALEASLKLREVSYIQGGGFPASELKHGTLAVVDGDILSVFLATDPAFAAKDAASAEQVLSRGGQCAVVTWIPALKEQFRGRAEVVEIPECGRTAAPFVAAAALQMLAYRTAVALGRDPDMPRNLAKSVTVE